RSARTWGETALKLAPKRWTTYPLLIDAYTGLGDYKAAKRTLDRLLKLHSGAAVVRARAAAVYRDRGWREDAAAALSDAAAASGDGGGGCAGVGAAHGRGRQGGAEVRHRGDGQGTRGRRAQRAVLVPPGHDRAGTGPGRTRAPASAGGAADQSVLLTAEGAG